ncbi:MAG: hypothetical protein KGM43_09610 [Planctomycetota bacterium]|nr:hypothetical protein [Planctomycetota bacterium]
MELTFACGQCDAVGRVESVERASEAVCASCGTRRPLHREAFDGSGGLRACAWCATDDLYVQKDFPWGLGLALVILSFAISTVFWYYRRPMPALGVLLLSALADMALYYIVGDVVICYRCLGQYRGAGANPDRVYKAFDLAVGERYRQEKMRIAELKKRDAEAPENVPKAP